MMADRFLSPSRRHPAVSLPVSEHVRQKGIRLLFQRHGLLLHAFSGQRLLLPPTSDIPGHQAVRYVRRGGKATTTSRRPPRSDPGNDPPSHPGPCGRRKEEGGGGSADCVCPHRWGPPGSGPLSAAGPTAGGSGVERAPRLSIGRPGLHHVSLIKDALCLLLLLLLLGRGRLEERRGGERKKKKQHKTVPPPPKPSAAPYL